MVPGQLVGWHRLRPAIGQLEHHQAQDLDRAVTNIRADAREIGLVQDRGVQAGAIGRAA